MALKPKLHFAPRTFSGTPFSRKTHATVAGFVTACLLLSTATFLPPWLRPLDVLAEEDPWTALFEQVFSKPASMPLPDQEVDQLQASNDPLLLDPLPAETKPRPSKPEKAWRPSRPVFDRYAERLGLSTRPIESLCKSDCEDPMGVFLDRLSAAEQGEAQVKVVHFGDSLIASDKIADVVRRRVTERFGSAGRGLLFAKRFNQFQRGQRSGRGSSGWKLQVMTDTLSKLRDRQFGLFGASFVSEKRGETLRFSRIQDSRFLAVHYLASPSGGRLRFLADGAEVRVLSTKHAVTTATVARFELAEGTEQLVLQSKSKGVRLFGVELSSASPGVSWSTLGLPGATSEVWLRPDKAAFLRLFKGYGPHLAVIMLGGNDGLMLAKKRQTEQQIEQYLDRFVLRLRAAVPGLNCLMVTPLESVRAKPGGRLIPKPELQQILAITRRVAEKRNCALWDMYASMGGKGSIARWVKARLMLGDLIHPRSRGSDLLGEMFAEALMRAYDERP